MSNGPFITKCVMFGITTFVLTYDVFAYAYWGNGGEATFSKVFYALAKEHPITAFAMGVVWGHILWRDSR